MHRIIIINSGTPTNGSMVLAETADEQPYKVSVEYRPDDSMSAAEVGKEVARIQRKIDQITGGHED